MQCIIMENNLIKLLHHDETMKRAHDTQIVRGKENLKLSHGGSETMLAVGKYVVSVEVSHNVADNYMFKHLTADAGKRYRPVVTGFELFTFLVYC